MRLTQVLNSPPIFRFWKHFGAGLKRRQPNFKHWRHTRIAFFDRRKIPDNTLPAEMLPPGARLVEADDLMTGHVDEMPDEMLERKQSPPILYDHPWPFNVKLNPINSQAPIHCYNINTRFYKPVEDCQVLTNSLIETDSLEAHPPLEPSNEHMEAIQRHIDWATKGDSLLVRLAKDRSPMWPRLNVKVRRQYGITKERMEVNIMNSITSYVQMLLAKHYHEQGDQVKLDEILSQRSVAYPHCTVPFERGQDNAMIHMDLFIDSMMLSSKPLPQIETKPDATRLQEPLSIRPRTWRSLLEKTRNYSPSWSFTLPRSAQLHTSQLSSRILRKHRNDNEMLARLMVHAFGLTSQFARFRAVSNHNETSENDTSAWGTCVLQNPLDVEQVNQKDLLDQPIVLQTIGYDHHLGQFRFMRYQLNTLNFNDQEPGRVKNQAWHSGPISDLEQVLRYYLDFQAFDSTQVDRMLADTLATRKAKLEAEQRIITRTSTMVPEKLAEGY